MKRDAQRKKMRLSREVLRNLRPDEAAKVAGGISVGTCTACRYTYCCQTTSVPCGSSSDDPLAC